MPLAGTSAHPRCPCRSLQVRATLVTAFRQNGNPAQAELYDLPREPPPCAVARQALLAGAEGGVCAPAGYSAQGGWVGVNAAAPAAQQPAGP